MKMAMAIIQCWGELYKYVERKFSIEQEKMLFQVHKGPLIQLDLGNYMPLCIPQTKKICNHF